MKEHPAEQALKDIAAFIGASHINSTQPLNINLCVAKIKDEIIRLTRFEFYNMTSNLTTLVQKEPVHFTGDIRSVIRTAPILK
jgi:hypothetical protein